MGTRLTLRLLGPPEVRLGGEPAVGFASDKVRALLFYLAVGADRPGMGGLLLWMDNQNYLGLQWGYFGPRQVALEGAVDNVDAVIGRGLLPEGVQERAFLRLERRGDQVTAFCSADGEAWFSVGRARFPARPAQVGLYAIGRIDRGLYPGAYLEGTAVRFEQFELWEA